MTSSHLKVLANTEANIWRDADQQLSTVGLTLERHLSCLAVAAGRAQSNAFPMGSPGVYHELGGGLHQRRQPVGRLDALPAVGLELHGDAVAHLAEELEQRALGLLPDAAFGGYRNADLIQLRCDTLRQLLAPLYSEIGHLVAVRVEVADLSLHVPHVTFGFLLQLLVLGKGTPNLGGVLVGVLLKPGRHQVPLDVRSIGVLHALRLHLLEVIA
mmetsp:Transcript_177711/g.569707  ORF Transcript_177711/g.569707 Transcript_177711/m.569707 type:complete len:214 (+) Transcript_177711:26-667(+)|eukprot:CAMPEP_0203996756 /NCGR_PEP_ID=MMETSP0360-20130528/12932_1 /ASSEMBLY_ACC=CAM_ASM_000342 /TAXON_ID=268821 /ORGANISM="Scrippsiella Hangoei, Strain SHTV-5" /LENGTH=213 /DNA_ID=CAMNT_0050937593 /DNA_START=24 /DNA_END=665 /DNA_ORIENTATION=-